MWNETEKQINFLALEFLLKELFSRKKLSNLPQTFISIRENFYCDEISKTETDKNVKN